MSLSMSNRSRVAALIVPLFVLAACGSGGEDSSTASEGNAPSAGTAAAEAADCAPVSGPMIEVNAKDDEPRLEIPQPEGWERNTQLDSEVIRLALINPSLVQDQFSPNLVVTAEPSAADVHDAFDVQFATMAQTLGIAETDINPVDGELCGFPTKTVEYMLPAMGATPERPALVQILVVPGDEDSTTYTFTSQATEPIDPSYVEDVQTMLDGVQVLEGTPVAG